MEQTIIKAGDQMAKLEKLRVAAEAAARVTRAAARIARVADNAYASARQKEMENQKNA